MTDKYEGIWVFEDTSDAISEVTIAQPPGYENGMSGDEFHINAMFSKNKSTVYQVLHMREGDELEHTYFYRTSESGQPFNFVTFDNRDTNFFRFITIDDTAQLLTTYAVSTLDDSATTFDAANVEDFVDGFDESMLNPVWRCKKMLVA